MPVIVGVIGALLLLLRLTLAGSPWNRVWAEDGAILLAESGASGVWTLFSGHLHVLPRLLATTGAALPVEAFAAWALFASIATVGVLAAFIYWVSVDLLGSRLAAGVAALALALAPAVKVETAGNLANLQWFLLPACFWALLAPRGSRMEPAAAAVAGLATLTTPLVLLLAPAAMLRGRSALRSRPVQAAACGLAVQGLAMVAAPVSALGGVERNSRADRELLTLALATVLPGEPLGSALRELVVLLVVLVAVCALLLRARHRGIGVAALACAAAVLLFTAFYSGAEAPRYAAAATGLGAAALAVALVGRERWLAATVLIPCGLLALATFRVDEYRTTGPSWHDAVAEARRVCTDARKHVDVPLSPQGWGAARLTCEQATS